MTDDREVLSREEDLVPGLRRTTSGASLSLHRQDLADQPDQEQFEQKGEACSEYVDEQLFHDRQVRSRW
jgi:hypothetical protein